MQTIDTLLDTMQRDSAQICQARTNHGHLPFSDLWLAALTPKAITRLYFGFGLVGLPLRKMLLDLCALSVVGAMTALAWAVMTQGWLSLTAPVAPMMTGAMASAVALIFALCAVTTATRAAMTVATWYGSYLRLSGQGPVAVTVRRDDQATHLFDAIDSLRAAH